MTESQKEYADYLTRLARNNEKSVIEWNKERSSRDVGESYGLTEKEMDEVADET